MQAKFIDGSQDAKMQHGLDGREALQCLPGLNTDLHISLETINPGLTLWQLALPQPNAKVSMTAMQRRRLQKDRSHRVRLRLTVEVRPSLGLPLMPKLTRRHVGLNGTTLPEDVVALIQRYKHGNEALKYCVHLSGLWRLSPRLDSMLRAAFSIVYQELASPLDVHPSKSRYWTPFAADAAFRAEHDCWSIAWQGCSQISCSPHAEADVHMQPSARQWPLQ